MKFAYLCLPFASLVEADQCQEFCVRSLGDARCAQGSYCKSNGFCHSLQWTNDTQVSICVFGESPDCTDSHPVLCTDAQSSVVATTAIPSSLVTSVSDAGSTGNHGHSHHGHHEETGSNSTHAHCGHTDSEGALRGSHERREVNLGTPGALWARRRTRVPLLGLLCAPVGTPISCCAGPAHNETGDHGSHHEGGHADHSEEHHHH